MLSKDGVESRPHPFLFILFYFFSPPLGLSVLEFIIFTFYKFPWTLDSHCDLVNYRNSILERIPILTLKNIIFFLFWSRISKLLNFVIYKYVQVVSLEEPILDSFISQSIYISKLCYESVICLNFGGQGVVRLNLIPWNFF